MPYRGDPGRDHSAPALVNVPALEADGVMFALTLRRSRPKGKGLLRREEIAAALSAVAEQAAAREARR